MSQPATDHATATPLFTPFQLGPLTLPNRIVMAPMTRSRAAGGNVQTELNARYYAQRASAGLIITEATQVTAAGQGYVRTPGIHSDEQVAGWRLVTEAVHRAGGRIFAQLWHVGRISHTSFQPDGGAPVAPSAIAAQGMSYTLSGPLPFSVPRALALAEIPSVVAQFAAGARQAKAAGFDGVELHGANGYLIDQFLRDGSNQRTDAYGGSAANRARFLLEVTDAVVGVWGAERVGVRLSPQGAFNDMSDSDPATTFGHAAAELGTRKLAYLHLIEPVAGPASNGTSPLAPLLRQRFGGALILNGGYDKASAEAALAAGQAELISFGVPFLANPDLPERLARSAPFNHPDRSTFYSEGEKGYTDYPALL